MLPLCKRRHFVYSHRFIVPEAVAVVGVDTRCRFVGARLVPSNLPRANASQLHTALLRWVIHAAFIINQQLAMDISPTYRQHLHRRLCMMSLHPPSARCGTDSRFLRLLHLAALSCLLLVFSILGNP